MWVGRSVNTIIAFNTPVRTSAGCSWKATDDILEEEQPFACKRVLPSWLCGLVSCTSQHSLYHREVRKCLPGPLRQFYSHLDHHQTLFTIASATEPLLISQSLFSEGGRRDSKDEIIFKNGPKSPGKDCSTWWPTPCLSQGREREFAYHCVSQSLRKCLCLLASSPPLFRELRWGGIAAAAPRTSHLGSQGSTGTAPSLCSISLSCFNGFSINYHFALIVVSSTKKIHGRSWTVWVWCSRGHTTDNAVKEFTEANSPVVLGERENWEECLDLGRGIHSSVKVCGMTILTLGSFYSAHHNLQVKKQGSSRDEFTRVKGELQSPRSVSLHLALWSHRYAWTDRAWLPKHKSSFNGIPCPSFSQEHGEGEEIAQLGISAVSWWEQKHTVHKAWRKIFDKRKWCVSNETPTFPRVMFWQYLEVMGCSDGSLKTRKPGEVADSPSPSASFQTKQSSEHWRRLLPVAVTPHHGSLIHRARWRLQAHQSICPLLFPQGIETLSTLLQKQFWSHHRLQWHLHCARPPKCTQLSSFPNALGRATTRQGTNTDRLNFSS